MKKENIFKQKLYHHTMPVRDGLWDAIEAQLPPKKDQRVFPLFWLILFGTTLLGGILMLGIFNQHQTSTSGATPSQVTNSSHADSDIQVYATKQTESAILTDPNEIDAKSTTSNSLENPSSAGSPASLGDRAIIGAKAGSDRKTTTLSPSSVPTAKNPSTAAPATEATLSTYNNHPASANLPIPSVGTNFHLTSVPFLPQQEMTLAPEERMLPAMYAVKPDPNCYKFSGTGSRLVFSVDVFAGPGFSPKTFMQRDSESSIYADARIATENHQYGWSTGARLNLQHRSGFTGRIGLSYTQVGDIFDYTDSLATQSTTRIDSFFAADGTFLYTETSQVLILGTLIKKIHNTYRYLDVPLIIGYEMPMGRSTFLVNAGPVFNISSSHEGQILDPNLHPRSIKEGEPGAISVYKSNIGLSLYLGAGYLFPISNHFSGLIEPTFVYRLSPVSLPSYPLQEQRHYAGLNLGIRYHIH